MRDDAHGKVVGSPTGDPQRTGRDGQLCWATEDAGGPAVLVSPHPLHQAPERIPLPVSWQVGGGAEVADLIGYSGSLCVFFLTKTSNPAEFGFWAATVKKA